MFSTRKPEDFYPGQKTGSDFTKRFSYMTNMDLLETPSEYKVLADVPGVPSTNLKVWLDDYDMYIDAIRVDPFEGLEQQGELKVHHRALPYGEIKRNIKLPKDAALDQGKTLFRDGVLQVSFPKMVGKLAEPEHKTLPINIA